MYEGINVGDVVVILDNNEEFPFLTSYFMKVAIVKNIECEDKTNSYWATVEGNDFITEIQCEKLKVIG